MTETRKLFLLDTSLTDKSLTDDQKLQLARLLKKINVDIIQLPENHRDLSLKIASEIKTTKLAISCEPLQNKLDQASEILKNVENSRLRLMLTRELLQKVNLDKIQDKNDVLKLVKDSIAYAQKLTDDVEFIIINFEGLHNMFIYRLIEQAADVGIKTITIADYEGYCLTHESAELFSDIFFNIPDYKELLIGTSNKNTLGSATANTVAAILNGALQAEVRAFKACTSDSTASLRALLTTLKTRKKLFKLTTSVIAEELENACTEAKESLAIR